MNIMKLAVAAALAFGTISVASAPVAASADQRSDYRDDRRGDYRDDRRDDNRRDWRGDRGRHHGWRNNRGRHRGWYTRRVCRTIWRHGERRRVCRIVRYRRHR